VKGIGIGLMVVSGIAAMVVIQGPWQLHRHWVTIFAPGAPRAEADRTRQARQGDSLASVRRRYWWLIAAIFVAGLILVVALS
jgi:hypothetical protein